jgi:hypothetical protein
MANIPFSRHIETILADARYGMRGLLREPGFALTALLAIALGVGSAVAVFSVVDRALFRSLPYPAGERMAQTTLSGAINSRRLLR